MKRAIGLLLIFVALLGFTLISCTTDEPAVDTAVKTDAKTDGKAVDAKVDAKAVDAAKPDAKAAVDAKAVDAQVVVDVTKTDK